MAKEKTLFACTACGFETAKWMGKCPGCGAWNTLEETVQTAAAPVKAAKQRPGTGAVAMLLKDIPEDATLRISTGISELDRVLGGGIVRGSLVLVGGDPGIGKSTLLLQMCREISREHKVLYISGEESLQQIKGRADRLGRFENELYLQMIILLNAIFHENNKFVHLCFSIGLILFAGNFHLFLIC